ncbi:hypothetical protein RvY_09708 [Ramazzottius varieornatus]|uniref:Uncharacterized protein n=1 Tax=Ramazzottius varieornatus TaxID=947166 RepID=A0A1D1VCF6_RAMVA|nr:hypothetical protein RvY_09708 [Ramazzottius varieornatus]
MEGEESLPDGLTDDEKTWNSRTGSRIPSRCAKADDRRSPSWRSNPGFNTSASRIGISPIVGAPDGIQEVTVTLRRGNGRATKQMDYPLDGNMIHRNIHSSGTMKIN